MTSTTGDWRGTKSAARVAYDTYVAECPSRKLLDRISDKWVSLDLTALADRYRRYNELSRTIAGASPKMLTQTLRSLEPDGLVSRSVLSSVPVRVDYALTPPGATLLPVMNAIKTWARTNIEHVDAARERYDSDHAAA
jgi:DNA-binding HxlR family transcriptional regulator